MCVCVCVSDGVRVLVCMGIPYVSETILWYRKIVNKFFVLEIEAGESGWFWYLGNYDAPKNSYRTSFARGRWVIQRLWDPPPPHTQKTCRGHVSFWRTLFFLLTFIAHWLLTHDDMMVEMNDATDHHEHRVSFLKFQCTSSCSIGCTNAPDCYVTRTLPVLLLICDHFRYNFK